MDTRPSHTETEDDRHTPLPTATLHNALSLESREKDCGCVDCFGPHAQSEQHAQSSWRVIYHPFGKSLTDSCTRIEEIKKIHKQSKKTQHKLFPSLSGTFPLIAAPFCLIWHGNSGRRRHAPSSMF